MSYSFIDIYTHTTIFTNWLEYHKFENIFRQADIGFWHFWHIRCMFKRLSIWIGWIEGCIQKWRTNTFLIFIVNGLGTWLRLWFCHIYKSCPSHLAVRKIYTAFISKSVPIGQYFWGEFNWFNPLNKMSSQLSIF